jgi:hypothetical protein
MIVKTQSSKAEIEDYIRRNQADIADMKEVQIAAILCPFCGNRHPLTEGEESIWLSTDGHAFQMHPKHYRCSLVDVEFQTDFDTTQSFATMIYLGEWDAEKQTIKPSI